MICYDISWADSLSPIVLLAVVVFAFILCWLPFHVGRYLFSKSFEPGSLEIAQISQYCNLVSFVLFYLSAAINPILYNIMSKKYRVAVFRLLGFEPFSQRKLSTLKDESSRAWTESSINTWPSTLLSTVTAYYSKQEDIAQQNLGGSWRLILELGTHRSGNISEGKKDIICRVRAVWFDCTLISALIHDFCIFTVYDFAFCCGCWWGLCNSEKGGRTEWAIRALLGG